MLVICREIFFVKTTAYNTHSTFKWTTQKSFTCVCVCVCFWFKIVVGGVCTESLKSSFETQVSLLAPYIYSLLHIHCAILLKRSIE